jgi:hypothetical protein
MEELGKKNLPAGTLVHVRVDWEHFDVGNDFDHWYTVSEPGTFVDSLRGNQDGKTADKEMCAWVHAGSFGKANRKHLHTEKYGQGAGFKKPKKDTTSRVCETSGHDAPAPGAAGAQHADAGSPGGEGGDAGTAADGAEATA